MSAWSPRDYQPRRRPVPNTFALHLPDLFDDPFYISNPQFSGLRRSHLTRL